MTNDLRQLFGSLGTQIDPILLFKAVEQNPAVIVITDSDGNIIYTNKKFSEMTGYNAEEALGENPRLLKGNDGYTDYAEMWRKLLLGQEWRGDFHNKKKNGAFFWERASISPIMARDGRITHFLAIKEDITERKKIEEDLERTVAESTQMAISLEFLNAELKSTQSQMLQREKMASIGQLAAGVAHEINNPIGFVSSNLRSLGKYLIKLTDYVTSIEADIDIEAPQLKEKVREQKKKLRIDFLLEDCNDLIEESLDGSERVRKIVQNLKTFSRVDCAEVQMANLNECVESTLNIVWNEIKYKATLEKNLRELPDLHCNPRELSQVFTNILMNASQAIDKDGVIKVCSWQKGNMLFVSFEDNGCGISQEHKDKIFEPFFTTKQVGEGTGLGMSISYEIVKNHGGDIVIDSEPGVGTTMTVSFSLTS
jgi:two-component system, NtrC family, sensor kinase